jgi:hypothetical protein
MPHFLSMKTLFPQMEHIFSTPLILCRTNIYSMSQLFLLWPSYNAWSPNKFAFLINGVSQALTSQPADL